MNEITLKICWMYHNIMDLYGDKGNIMVLQRRCRERGINVIVDTCAIGEQCDFCAYDLLFLGGGADREQILLIDDLRSRRDNIAEAIEQGTFVFLICGGYQLFGQYYIAADGTKIDCLQFFDYYTEAGDHHQRCIGNIAIECTLENQIIRVVGFENHGGQTRNVASPLGRVLSGLGNNMNDHQEGFYDGHVLATYMHGPLLPKNPQIADFILYKSIQKQHPHFTFDMLKPLDDTMEYAARDVMLQRLQVK